MSPSLIRNWARLAILSLAALSGAAFAQATLFSDGYKFLKAVRETDVDVVTAMVEEPGFGSLINTRDQTNGQTAMHIVTERGDVTWIRYLVANGANPNIADKEGVTPLVIATRQGDLPSVTALLESGARVDPLTSTGETPLIFAVHKRDIPLVRVLLGYGADPDRADNSGRTARDYVELIGERRLSDAFATADQALEDVSSQQYGPSL